MFLDRLRTALCITSFTFGSSPMTALAQSTDVKHPTPLGPGINRGNIVSDTGARYYTFVVGPGHVEVDMAFKEMGVFGAPFRQSLNFDFYKEDGTMSGHNVVVSQGVLARNHLESDVKARQRYVLAITTQRGLIKLGGYYEIAIKGAVAFDGATTGAGVVPHDTAPLVAPPPH